MRFRIGLKEGRDFEVDRKAGTITFRTPPVKGARTSIGFDRAGSVTASMVLPLRQAVVFWFKVASMRARSVVARRNASSATH